MVMTTQIVTIQSHSLAISYLSFFIHIHLSIETQSQSFYRFVLNYIIVPLQMYNLLKQTNPQNILFYFAANLLSSVSAKTISPQKEKLRYYLYPSCFGRMFHFINTRGVSNDFIYLKQYTIPVFAP